VKRGRESSESRIWDPDYTSGSGKIQKLTFAYKSSPVGPGPGAVPGESQKKNMKALTVSPQFEERCKVRTGSKEEEEVL